MTAILLTATDVAKVAAATATSTVSTTVTLPGCTGCEVHVYWSDKAWELRAKVMMPGRVVIDIAAADVIPATDVDKLKECMYRFVVGARDSIGAK